MRAVERVTARAGDGSAGTRNSGDLLLRGEQFIESAGGHDLLALGTQNGKRARIQHEASDDPQDGAKQHPSDGCVR